MNYSKPSRASIFLSIASNFSMIFSAALLSPLLGLGGCAGGSVGGSVDLVMDFPKSF